MYYISKPFFCQPLFSLSCTAYLLFSLLLLPINIFYYIVSVYCIIAIVGFIASSDTGSSSGSGSGSSYGSSSYTLDSYYINMVKNAKNSTYGITYGSAFNRFFSSPGWDYFMSTSGQHVVEFEGGFYYSGSPTTAKIQFVLDLDSGTFTAYHLSFDGESQSRMMLSALIEKAFESY